MTYEQALEHANRLLTITDGYIPCEKCYNKSRKKLINETNSKRKAEDKLEWTSLIT